MDTSAQQSMNEAMDRLWAKFLPEMVERVALIEAANRAFAENKLSNTQRAEANSAAHKLAGVLGTFGLTKGTVLARETELLYSGDEEPDPDLLPRLNQITQQLKALVESRK